MRKPILNLANVQWRTIAGIDFQQVEPYVMVAKPDHMRSVWVWLRRDRGASRWDAYVVPAGGRVGAPIASDASAQGALAVVMALPEWSREVVFKPTRQVVTPEWSYPEEGRSYKHRPGSYADRGTAHDSRWDHVNSGVGPYT